MKLGDAFPDVFKRATPMASSGDPLIVTATLLRLHQTDAIPIVKIDSENKLGRILVQRTCITGHSILSTILRSQVTELYSTLLKPCDLFGQVFESQSIDNEISRVLHMMEKSRFGFVFLHSDEEVGFLDLRDLLNLYAQRIFSSDLRLIDVGSPLVTLPHDSTLKEVLSFMFAQRVRRVLVAESKAFVTDRGIINYLFSPDRLKFIRDSPDSIFDVRLGEISLTDPLKVSAHTNLKEAASLLANNYDNCLIFHKWIVTPWDLIIKPYKLNKLRVGA